MVRAIVGGREFDYTKEQIEQRMRGVPPETIREHVVEMLDTVYPPKQVFATVTGWDRNSFTTMEAQRVLTRAGFVCRRAAVDKSGRRVWAMNQAQDDEPIDQLNDDSSTDARLAKLENALSVAQAAIASLADRIQKLESSGQAG